MDDDFEYTSNLREGLTLGEDPAALLNSRDWLQKALESQGAVVTGGGIGCEQADVDINLDGFKFNVSIRPL